MRRYYIIPFAVVMLLGAYAVAFGQGEEKLFIPSISGGMATDSTATSTSTSTATPTSTPTATETSWIVPCALVQPNAATCTTTPTSTRVWLSTPTTTPTVTLTPSPIATDDVGVHQSLESASHIYDAQDRVDGPS